MTPLQSSFIQTTTISFDSDPQNSAFINSDLPTKNRETEAVVPYVEPISYATREKMEAVQAVISFLEPSDPNEYRDADSGKTYYNPDHSHLVPLAMSYFSQGQYKGIGLTRKKEIILPGDPTSSCCDLLYFTKHQDQIDYENRKSWSQVKAFLGFTGKIEQRIKQQVAIYKKLKRKLPKHAEEWGYDKTRFFESPEILKKINFSEKDAESMHLIAFTYKEKA